MQKRNPYLIANKCVSWVVGQVVQVVQVNVWVSVKGVRVPAQIHVLAGAKVVVLVDVKAIVIVDAEMVVVHYPIGQVLAEEAKTCN